jgi:prepilin-type N-terminal cleavage/methylation domain-containing protein
MPWNLPFRSAVIANGYQGYQEEMKTMRRSALQGVTIIEVLVVIAIIAVLAAILFPVFGRVRENTRQATCISNMKEMYRAASMYKTDYGEYPMMLLGPAEQADGLPYRIGDTNPPVSAAAMKRGFLYPNYVKSIDAFRCPNNPDTNPQKVVQASYAPSSPWSSILQQQFGRDYPTFGGGLSGGGFPFQNLPQNYDGLPIPFYAINSYDITAFLQPDGRRRASDYQIVYSRDWTGTIGKQDAVNQLKYPNPPTDRTIIAWCNYHVVQGGSDLCTVVLASGTATKQNYRKMVQYGWNYASAP